LNTPAFAGEVVEFHSYNTTSYGGGGGGGGGASNLNNLSDVSIGSLADDQLLQYNNATSQWINVSASSVVNAASSFATKSVTPTTATAGQTTFSGTYTVGFVDVYLNGVKLSEDQYTATTGTNIVLDEGASANDIIEVIGLTSNVPASGGGGSYADSDVDGHLNTSTASSGEVLSWTGTDYDWVAQSGGSGITTANINADTLNVSGISTFNDKVAIGTDAVSNSGKLHFPTADGYIHRASISVGNPIIDYGLYVVDSTSNPNSNLHQNYVRQTTSGNYSVSVGASQAFRISNNAGSSSATLDPGGMQDSQVAFVVQPNTSTELRYNYDTKLETTGYGVTVTGGVNASGIVTANYFYANGGLYGSSLQIGYPLDVAGSALNAQVYLDNVSGHLQFGAKGTSSGRGNFIFYKKNGLGSKTPLVTIYSDTGNMYVAGTLSVPYGITAPLHYFVDNSKKLEVTGYGVTVYGGVNASGIVTAASFSGNGNDIVHSTWTLGANGSSHYTFTGPGGLSNTDDPKIYLARGQTYEFVNNSGGSHPFQIQQSNGSAYSTGVTNNGASSGTIRFEVPFSAPNTLQYKCTSHSSMGNTIIVYPDISP
jgi:plastocyanin